MIAVTTHSRTRGLRHSLLMLLASRRVERELRDAPGCQRYASVVAGPRELWTLTIWRDASDLRRCMRGGTHGRLVWKQPHWLESYWGMRWAPGDHRSGEWEGEAWQWPHLADPEPSPPPTPDTPSAMPSSILAALGKTVPLERREVAGAAGATYRLRVPPWGIPAALCDLRRVRRIASADGDLFTVSLGLGTGGALYLLLVARSPEALERVRAQDAHGRLLRRWGDRAWWSTWEPESEFGHWESHRLRDGQLAVEPPLLDMRLPVHLGAAREARRALRERLHALDPKSLETLQLLTSELVTNGANHAGLEPADRMGLQVRARGDWIRVEVIDRGRRFEPHVPLSKSPGDTSGWGLFMLDRASERWGISHGHERHVWFELRVPVSDPREPDAAPRT